MTDISTLGQSLSQISRLKAQQQALDTLTSQLTTGKKSQSFSGLGTDALASKRARASLHSIESYVNNIKNANRRIEQINLAIEQFKTQAENISAGLASAPQQGDYPDYESIQQLAENSYDFLLDLINTKDGDRYLFAGADTGTRPVTDTGLYSSFLGEFVPDEADLTNPPLVSSGAVGLWGSGTITTEEFINSYRNVSDTTLGYSASLVSGEAGSVYARVDDGKQLDYTVLGNSEGFREIVIAIGALRSLPPPEYAPGALNDPTATTFANDTPPFPPTEKQENFYAVVNDLREMINSAVDKLSAESFKIAQTQVQMDQLNKSYTFESKLLQDTIGEVENIDLTEVSVKISSLQIQIEASYSVTASISQLSLVNFFR